MRNENDIVVEFACSRDSNDFKQYHVVNGSIFSDEFNETLDSAVVVLEHVKAEDRLFNLEPYQYVHVYDSTNRSNLDRLYLIDNYSERETNIHKNIFGYTINLMSETKILEKIQCPNLAITHKVVDGVQQKETILTYIRRYLELYVPNIKKDGLLSTWSYEKLIRLPSGSEIDLYNKFINKFNVPCADFSLSAGTLRQVLTALMQQVGCIPTVNKGILGFLDFNETPEDFNDYTANYSVSRIQRSLSSDSYANTLINMSSNVLDSENTVISETLGFRDKNSVTLKQTENLYLETKFPIYKVEKFVMKAFSSISGKIHARGVGSEAIELFDAEGGSSLGKYSFGEQYYHSGSGSGIHCAIEEYTTGQKYTTEITVSYKANVFKNNIQISEMQSTETIAYSSTTNRFDFDIQFSDDEDIEANMFVEMWIIRMVRNDTSYNVTPDYVSALLPAGTMSNFIYYMEKDITPLLLENSIRQALETNYKEMNELGTNATIEDLAKYIYGTIGYSIGSKRISGFSDNYSEAYAKIFGTVEVRETYIENIWNFLFNRKVPSSDYAGYLNRWLGYHFQSWQIYDIEVEPWNDDDIINFSILTFDIKYQPLNSFNLAYVKQNKDLPYPIEQFDSSDSGLTDFDRLSIHEQETVDRIGNDVISVSQRTDTLSNIQGSRDGQFVPTIFRDDKNRDGDWSDPEDQKEYIIFKRQIAVSNYYYEVSYTGMENAILKNYFTSIRTKYRAFEYVDYNQSVLRKERDVIFARLGTDYYDGSDNIHFHNVHNVSDNNNGDILCANLVNGETYSIRNVGTSRLSVFAIDNNGEEIRITPAATYIAPDETYTFTISGSDYRNIRIVSYLTSSLTTTTGKFILESGEQVYSVEGQLINGLLNKEYDKSDEFNTKYPQNKLHYICEKSEMNEVKVPSGNEISEIYFKGSYSIAVPNNENLLLKDVTYTLKNLSNSTGTINSFTLLGVNDEETQIVLSIIPPYNDYLLPNASITFTPSFNVKKIEMATGTAQQTIYATIERNVEGETLNPTVTKNDISLITTDKIFAIIYENDDNVSAGPYIGSVKYNTFFGETTDDYDKLGGVPQAWQIWKTENYNPYHMVSFYKTLSFNTLKPQPFYSEFQIYKSLQVQSYLPIVIDEVLNNTPINAKAFDIGRKLTVLNGDYNRVFYKDYAERINHTVEFVYYTNEDNIKWTELFIKNSSLIQGLSEPTHQPNRVVFDRNWSEQLNTNLHEKQNVSDSALSSSYVSVGFDTISNKIFAYINVTWHNHSTITVAYRNSSNEYQDFIAFKRPDNNPTSTKFYVTFNDSKSDRVMTRTSDGLLYDCGKVRSGAGRLFDIDN